MPAAPSTLSRAQTTTSSDPSGSTTLRSSPVAPPGFCDRGEVRYGFIGGVDYEVPQSRLKSLCINVALCSTALQCICRVIRRTSMTMKAHTYYIIFGRPRMGEASPSPPLGGATVRYRLSLIIRLFAFRFAFSALTLLVGQQEVNTACRKLSD